MHKIKIILLLLVLSNYPLLAQLNPGDGIRLTVFNITDAISGDYIIQQNGNLQLPYVGEFTTSQKGFDQLRTEIVQRYDSLYRSPELTILPLYKIYIHGEVNKPGYFYLTGVEKLTELIAMSGGETTDANMGKIYLVRQNSEVQIDAEKIIEEGSKLSDIGLKSGDMIYVPKRWWVSARNTAYAASGLVVIITIISLFRK